MFFPLGFPAASPTPGVEGGGEDRGCARGGGGGVGGAPCACTSVCAGASAGAEAQRGAVRCGAVRRGRAVPGVPEWGLRRGGRRPGTPTAVVGWVLGTTASGGISSPPLPFFPFSLMEWVLSRLPFILISTVIILDLILGPLPVGRASSPPLQPEAVGEGSPVLPFPPPPPKSSHAPPRVRVRACARCGGCDTRG